VGHFLAEDSAFDKAVWPIHKPVGALLFVLALLRAIWGLANAGRRPASVNRAAHLGHLTLYVLMLAIPAIGLLRQYGSGRAFEPFGLMVFEARPDKVQWMTDLGGLLHGELGWLFLACIVGHVGLAMWHRRKGPDVLPRMIG
jgi:cytochrome b561